MGASFVVFDEPSEAARPGEGSLDEARLGSRTNRARLRQLDDFEGNSVLGGRRRWLLARVSLVDEGDLDAFARLGLNGLGDPADLGAVGVGGCDMQSQKMAERIDGQMQLRPLLAFGSVISRASAALGGRAQGAAVDDGGGRLLGPARGEAQDDAQILGQRLEAARAQPSPRLLVDNLPGRQIVGHPPPWRARLHI